ncbi:Hypothetical predicted protein [Olea europaea subsp. europaea]|uniref:Uncharacterized protein n=1 Tax=Olea europaea subsp. europaea TaxID=158383 RepID=A0A8S0SAG9_OLEEU|nr:Hypothetical predicted protein [Olea europaea subsp. europaea]
MEINEIFGDSQRENVLTKSAIYVWGYNQSGQTCRRGKEQGPEAVSAGVFLLSRRHKFQWLHIACGCEHTTATAFDGSLFTWDKGLRVKGLVGMLTNALHVTCRKSPLVKILLSAQV